MLHQRVMIGTAGNSARRKLGRSFVRFACDTLPLIDVAACIVGGLFASFLTQERITPADASLFWGSPESRVVIWSLLAPFLLEDRGFRATVTSGSWRRLIGGHLLRFVQFSALVLLVSWCSGLTAGLSLRWVALSLGLMGLLTLGSRVILTAHMRLLERGGMLAESIAVIGAGPLADRFVAHLRSIGNHRVDIVGVFDDRQTRFEQAATRPNGTIADLLSLARKRSIDCIVVALPNAPETRINAIVDRFEHLSVPVALCPAAARFEADHHIVDTIGDSMPVELLVDRPMHRWDTILKAAMDFLLASLAVLMLSPVLIAIAIGVRLSGPGPILFKQRRHGWNNGEFYIYKFRSMRWEGDTSKGPLKQTSRTDSRITPIGNFLRKSSLDELPQLFNVLKGEMSLVGPRPHATNMRTEDRLGHEIIDAYAHRHRVKPGITGWAQINGARGATDTTDQLRRRVELDLYYIENWSLWLDIKILFGTVLSVMKATNAF